MRMEEDLKVRIEVQGQVRLTEVQVQEQLDIEAQTWAQDQVAKVSLSLLVSYSVLASIWILVLVLIGLDICRAHVMRFDVAQLKTCPTALGLQTDAAIMAALSAACVMVTNCSPSEGHVG